MKEELLEQLKKFAYKEGEFTLSSGKKSEHYVNCKPVTLSSDGLWIVSDLLLQHVDDDVVAGTSYTYTLGCGSSSGSQYTFYLNRCVSNGGGNNSYENGVTVMTAMEITPGSYRTT